MYTCVASTSSGKISCSAELTVQGGVPREPEAPKVSTPTQKVDVKEGNSALLELTATGFPKPVITWTKDGEELKIGDKYKVLQEDDETYTMAISNVAPEDSGKYVAEAINDLGKDEVAYDLVVTSAPKFTKLMKNANVMINEDIEFVVEIEGSPEPSVSWCKDGQQLTPSERIKITSDGKIRKLVIKKAQTEDSGNYSCIIKNEHGSQGGYGAVQVNSPAKIVRGLSDVSSSCGEDAAFNVTVSGNPAPKLKWSKDGSELKIDGSRIIQREESESSYTLLIKKTTITDKGEYQCEVTNKYGKDTSKGKLIIKEKPKFEKKLTDVEANETDDIVFNLKIEGSPKPTVSWTKDGKELKIDGKHVEVKTDESDDSLTVIIHKSTTEDSGEYTCTITNTEGSEKTTSKVVVKAEEVSEEEESEEEPEKETEKKPEVEAPAFTKELKDVTVKEGDTVEFTVKFTGKPEAKWSKDGAELKIDNKHLEYKKEEADDSLTLVLKDARVEDSGKYTCTITNSSGSTSTSSKVTVTAEEKAPSFTKGLKDISVKENETVNFTVKFNGKPKPSVKWDKDGAELTIDSKHFEQRYEEAEDSLTLVLNKATKEDSGKYTCTITNSAGSETTSSKLVVEAEEIAPTFTQGLKDQTVKENETVNFTVKFSGKPKPTFKWDKDGAELTIDSKHVEQRYEEAEDSLTLVLNKATKEDAGKYTCTITNSAGSEKTSSKLEVSESVTSPSILKELKSVTAVEDESVDLTVKFDGTPKPTVKWQKDGQDIEIDDDHYEVTTEDDSVTLTINDITADDAGKYSCVISNLGGSTTTSADVTVKEQTNAPKFVKGLKDQFVKEEQTVKFTVKFTGKPKPTAKWTKDGAELVIDGDRVKSVEEAEDSLTIILEDTKKEDAGKYSCTITNSEGSDTSTCKLTVSESSSSPEFTQKLKDKEVKEGTTAEFTVKFTGKPTPTAKWTFDSDELTIDNTHIELKTEEDGASLTLVIKNTTKDDSGKYSCTITNSFGSQSCSGKLTVSAAPQIVKPLEDVEAEEGASLKLNVKYEGRPEPAVVWKKDGSVLDMDLKHYKTTIESDDSVSLVVEKLTKEDVGKYTCELTNPHGTASTSGNVTVTGKPVIKKPLGDKEVIEGETDAELIVEATGTPAPDVKWFLNGKELSEGESFGVTKDTAKGIYRLVLKKVTSETVGEVRFEATNSGGKAESTGKLTLLRKPRFLKDLTDMTLCEDDTIKLETTVDGSPMPEVKWYLGKKEIKASDQYEIISQGANQRLVIEECAVEDSGTYICKAKNKVGEVSQQATVTVKSKKDTQAPMFITHLYDQVIVVGDAARLEAKITGKPQPEVTWFKGSDTLEESECVLIKTDGDTYTLTLKDLKISDTSKYTCKAVNKYGEAKESAQLTVKEPTAPHIEELQDLEVRYGAPARLKAKISGFPIPEVSWLKDNSPIKKDSTYDIVTDAESNRYAVSIKAVKSDEIGCYSCIAKNSAGEAKCEANLSIKAEAPVFARDMQDQSVDMNEKFKFEVEVYGYPTPEISWLKDSKPITSNGIFTISGSGDIYKLEGIIKAIEDAGTFTCKATNKAGEDTRKATLTVSDFAPSVTAKLPSTVDLVEGDKLELKAKVFGKPTPEVK
ncbi:Muscle M-line assembly protein unc-89, partial [Stegodyphus mimosarum]